MPSTRQVRIIAVSVPAVNRADVGIRLRTDGGDLVDCLVWRPLALQLAAAIQEATRPGGPAGPKTSCKRNCPRRLSPAKLSAMRECWVEWRAGRMSGDEAARRAGVGHSSVSKYFTLWNAELSASAKAPALKPGGAIL